MDGSETPIQSSRAPERSGAPGVFSGTVTGVRRESGTQMVEIQGAQGRIKLQAEGDFQVGERIRVSMPPGGAVVLEKSPLPAGPLQDWGAGYQMPGNLGALKSVRAFEEQLANWVAGRQPGAGQGREAKPQPQGGDTGALLGLPLTELLKRVLSREGGRAMLLQALATLGPESFASLAGALEEGGADAGKSSLLAMLRGMRRSLEDSARASGSLAAGARTGLPDAAAAGTGASAGRAFGPGAMGAFWPGGPVAAPGIGAGSSQANTSASVVLNGAAESASRQSASPGMADAAGAATRPWLGRVLDRVEVGGGLSLAGGALISPSAKGPADPLYRYLLDLGGRTLEAYGGQFREPGDFVDFELEPQGARLAARFLDPELSLPPGLRSAFAAGTPESRAALQVASRTLEGFAREPFFEDLVKDFAGVLAQSGRFALPEGRDRLPAGQLPGPKELEGLLRLFVAFPRDSEQPERQARAWGEAMRDPKAVADLLRSLRPESESSLLRAASHLRASLPGSPADLAASPALPGTLSAGGSSGDAAPGKDVLASWLRRLLPEGFKPQELLDLARGSDHARGGEEGKEAKAAQFALQAFAGLVPREDEMREGRPNTFYYYHNQDWKGLQITWQRDPDRESRRRRDSDAPLKVRVETEAKHMGRVDVALTVKGDSASLHFRNQYHDVGKLLEEHMPELRKSAALLGVHIESWSYAPLEAMPPAPPTAGWLRPAALDSGLLDLTG